MRGTREFEAATAPASDGIAIADSPASTGTTVPIDCSVSDQARFVSTGRDGVFIYIKCEWNIPA